MPNFPSVVDPSMIQECALRWYGAKLKRCEEGRFDRDIHNRSQVLVSTCEGSQARGHFRLRLLCCSISQETQRRGGLRLWLDALRKGLRPQHLEDLGCR